MGLKASDDEFGTPEELFQRLNREFRFTIDAAASAENAKCPFFVTKEENALLHPERFKWQHVFCNPPYSKQAGGVGKWISYAFDLIQKPDGPLVWVFVVPTKTEQSFWHDIVLKHAEVRFLKKRQKFIGGDGSARGNHCVVIFRNPNQLLWG